MENHYAVPREIMKKRGNEENAQKTLDGVFEVKKPKAFTREGVLRAVAEFVVCDDQVSCLIINKQCYITSVT
jgi:hypothetical protein